MLAGDANIRLERAIDPHAAGFCDLITSYGFAQRVHDITHAAGGTLHIICTHNDLLSLTVDVNDISLSDYRLLRWQSSLLRPPPVYVTVTRRLWTSFDNSIFQANLLASNEAVR